VSAALLPGFDLPLMSLTAVSLALYLFTVRHPLKEVGFTIRLDWRDVRSALLGLLAYALVGVPLGLVIGFLKFEPHVPDGGELLTGILAGYLLVALIEEILFRGIIQNLLSKRLRRPWVGLGLSALIFGMAHLNNSTPGFPVPNWGYVLMATLAGLAYGWVWMRTGKVTASAITHMLVNLVWGIVLS
jgi:membrane protease YdiL (CAAX protease family)